MYVYQITNLVNNKLYIGITNNYKKRWGNHKCNSDPTMVISKAIKKYGINNFKFEILFRGLSIEEAEDKEIQLIQEKHSLVPEGYNVAKGGRYSQLLNPLYGADNGRALLTTEEVIYIRENRNQPMYILYEEFNHKISYETFKKVYHGKTYTNIQCNEVPIYPFNFEFGCQFAGGNLEYNEILELRLAYQNGIYWREMFQKYSDKFENEWSFWNVYNGNSYKLIMPEIFTSESKKLHASLARVGEKNGRAKLNANDVKEIRQLHQKGIANTEIYKLYPQVTSTTIRDIINNKTWKNIIL